MRTSTKITSVYFEGDYIIILSKEKEFRKKISEVSEKLAKASEIERNMFKISTSGYGIHWPLIDEDISLSGW
jgi:hypothetical protein